MKIAIVINTSWNIYNFRQGLVQALLKRGDEVVAIAPPDAYVDQLLAWGCTYHPVRMDGTGTNPVKDLLIIFRLRKIIKRTKPDVVLTYTIKPNLYGSIASGSLNIPCICNVSGLGTTFLWTGLMRTVAVKLYNFSFKYNKWVFFQNHEDRQDFLKITNLDFKKTSLLPGSGINIEKFSPARSTGTDKTVFLMISRLIIEKGVRDYIEAIRIIKPKYDNLEFHLLGGLDEGHARSISKSELDGWIDQQLVIYTDHQSDIRTLMSRADVVVLPSYREGTPRTLLEGGAMGKVLLASNVPGCREVVKDGYNGFLFEPQNPQDLAQKIEDYLLLSSQDQNTMGINSRKWVESTFDEQIVINAYFEKINQVTAASQSFH